MKSSKNRLLSVMFLWAGVQLLQGCAGTGRSIAVTSNPPGAQVLADGRKIGVTPMQITQSEAFPARWHGTSYMVKGELRMVRPGCEDFSIKVDDYVLLKDIDAQLNCQPGTTQANEPAVLPMRHPAAQTPAASASSRPMMDSDIEQRLKRLQELHEKGVITREEYAEQRRRILDSL